MTDQALLRRGLGDLQRSLERFETYNDGFILPDTFLVIRLDAHRYGDWSQVEATEYPCSVRLTRAFHATAGSLMASTFRVIMAYCHGDEICLFIDPCENNSPLRRSRILSTISSAAAIHFMESAGLSATFQARLSELPSLNRVIEYMLWQRRYCFRNAVTIALRSALLASRKNSNEIERMTHGVSEEQRIQQLEELGISLTSIPSTTRRGALLWWESDSGASPDNRSNHRLRTSTALPDDDAEFLDLIGQLVKGKSLATDGGVTQGLITPPAGRPIVTPPKQDSSPRRPSRRANVSVFKV